MTANRKSMHGMAKAKGCAHARLGDFCKMFPDLKTQAEACGYAADPCRADAVASSLGRAGGLMHDPGDASPDSPLPAAYTFFAQFVDHDVTLDTASALHGTQLRNAQIEKLPNLRTATLDLDCVYGFGPEASPHLYDPTQGGRLLVGSDVGGRVNPDDVPRNDVGRALIGDPRNDENLFVSQMQVVFLRFHNRLLVRYPFEKAQEEARFHYQYVVWNDFLRRITDPKVFAFADKRLRDLKKPYPLTPICRHEHPHAHQEKAPHKHGKDEHHHHRVCMPVEFSVAAYRFGHTTVRSEYPVNADFPAIELFDERFGTEGFSQVPRELVVDWRYLLDVEPHFTFQRAKAFDSLLTDELIRMPDPVVGKRATDDERSLAFRNLRRGVTLGLPSGQAVAAALANLNYPVDPAYAPDFTTPASERDPIPGAWRCIDPKLAKCLAEHTPLFLYLMREAAETARGERLGPVASAILLEVFGTMLRCCTDSFVTHPHWEPDPDIVWCRPSSGKGEAQPRQLSLADIVCYAAGPRAKGHCP